MRTWIRVWGFAAVAAVIGCGGSTETGQGGAAGSGGSKGGAAGIGGGVGGATGGVGGSLGGYGGGMGGCAAAAQTCGPTGTFCCNPYEGCGYSDPNGSVSCQCTPDNVWQCWGGGTGGAGGCVETSCGPTGAPCCTPGEGCGSNDPSGWFSCQCQGNLTWQCYSGTGGFAGSGGTGGCDPSACGPTGAPCCSPGIGCASTGPGGSISCQCTDAWMWQCSTGTGGVAGAGGGGGSCNGPSDCAIGTTCCAGHCVNPMNDPYNCGACGVVCPGPYPYCAGQCTNPPCWGPPPKPGMFCCGQSYCTLGQLCCEVQGPGPSTGPICYTPTDAQPTCPIGCPLCQ